MKILLYILLVIHVISLAILFLALLPTSIFTAILALFIGALEIALIIAVIMCLNDIESLKYDVTELYGKLHKLIKSTDSEEIPFITPSIDYQETSKKSWKCVKCDTVNKSNTDRCSNCGAEFSPQINPTFEPQLKKISRFVKFKDKKK